MIWFDHIAIAGETLEEAQEYVENALGVRLQPGGTHDVFFTHNAVLGLSDGLYLEAIASNPEAPKPARPRWFDLDRFSGAPRLTNWICRTDNMETTLALGLAGWGAPVALQRGALKWRMAVPDNGVLPFDNCAPALIQWDTSTHPADMLEKSGVRLTRLIVHHPQADTLKVMIEPLMLDDRVVFETGPSQLQAQFETPHGARMIAP
ncbi:MAG: VOC family protein [Roseobacter sp.]